MVGHGFVGQSSGKAVGQVGEFGTVEGGADHEQLFEQPMSMHATACLHDEGGRRQRGEKRQHFFNIQWQRPGLLVVSSTEINIKPEAWRRVPGGILAPGLAGLFARRMSWASLV